MSRNPFDYWSTDKSDRRTLGIRDKQILYARAKKHCENPVCRKKIEYSEMQVGHKTAASKGGKATLRNSVCLCYSCNKLQGTDSWATFLRKQGVTGTTSTVTTGKGQKGKKKAGEGGRKPKKENNPWIRLGEELATAIQPIRI